MDVNRTVKIGDLEYEVRYPIRLRARAEIERACDKAIYQAFTSGQIHDQAVIIWVGLKHAEKKLTIDKVLDLMQEHEDAGGDCSDVVRRVFDVAFTDKVLGVGSNYDLLRKTFDIPIGQEGKVQA